MTKSSASVPDRLGLACLAGFAFLAPFQGLGENDLSLVIGTHPATLLGLVGGALLLPRLPQLARESRPFWALTLCVLLAGLAALAALTPLGGAPGVEGSSWRDYLRLVALWLSVTGVAAATSRGLGRTLLLAGAAGGSLATLISLCGWGWFMLVRPTSEGLYPFVLRASHDVLGLIPRLSGTAGHSPQHFGETCVVTLALLLTLSQMRRPPWPSTRRLLARRLIFVALSGALIALLLTVSWAWAGGLMLLAGWIERRRLSLLWRRALLVPLGMVVLAGVYLVDLGLPEDLARSRAPLEAPCTALDHEHFVTFTRDGRICRQLPTTWPLVGRLTHYAEAHAAAWDAMWEHPWTGVGASGFAAYSAEHVARLVPPSDWRGSHYVTPHSTLAGPAATFGVPGLLGVLALFGSLLGSKPVRTQAFWPWLGLVALLVVGIHSELLWTRGMWLLLGLCVAAGSSPAEQPPEETPEAS